MPRRNHGFTLIELLVVLLIIGALTGLAALSIGQNDADRLDEAARRLAATLRLANEEAVLRGEELGLVLRRDGYGFLRLAGRDWQSIGNDPAYADHRLPTGLHLTLDLEGRPTLLGDSAPKRPQVLILSSGELTPFQLSLQAADGSTLYLRGGPLGEIVLDWQAEG